MAEYYNVEPKSRIEIRELALDIRKCFDFENMFFFPVVEFLEIMPEIFPKFYFEIVEDTCLPPKVHADTDVLNHYIRIKNVVYEGAYAGKGRDRMTIAHELGHYITISVAGFKLQRNFRNQKLRPYEDPEWQAKCFAGELLVPAHLVGGMDIYSIRTKCGVSLDAARKQLKSSNRGGTF